jgi:CheY-like chemotaxis protein
MPDFSLPPSLSPPTFMRRVLLVDDDDAVRRGLSRALRNSGYHVDTAQDGGEALRLLQTHTFDVVVSDINMPVLDGEGLLELMRDMELDVPLILITGDPDGVHFETEVQLLPKPVAPEQLSSAVDAVLTPESIAELV